MILYRPLQLEGRSNLRTRSAGSMPQKMGYQDKSLCLCTTWQFLAALNCGGSRSGVVRSFAWSYPVPLCEAGNYSSELCTVSCKKSKLFFRNVFGSADYLGKGTRSV